MALITTPQRNASTLPIGRGVISCHHVPHPHRTRHTTNNKKPPPFHSSPSHHLRRRPTTKTPSTTPSSTSISPPSSSFDWKDHWYPIVFTYDVAPGQLYPFTLLNTPIVIWRDGDTFRCFRDACPHRLVPLSEGRIAGNGTLECPYHGWQFNGAGACTVIPQGGDPSDPRAQATTYQCIAKQGLVWVRLRPASKQEQVEEGLLGNDVPILPELEDEREGWFELTPMWRDIPMEYSTLIENVVDAGHVPFTHHASVSKRQSSGTYSDMRVSDKGEWGFTGVWPTGPRKGGLGAQYTEFRGPNLMRHTIDATESRGFANITAVYGVPTTEGRCRLIVRQPFKFKNTLIRKLFGIAPAFWGHLGNLSVLDDDNIFLHLQEREAVERGLTEKPIGQVYYMPGASDAYVVTFRNWLERWAGGGPFGPQNKEWLARAGRRLTQDELLEHYHSHTEKCSICRTALKRIQRVKSWARAVTVGGGVTVVAQAMNTLLSYSAAGSVATTTSSSSAVVALLSSLVQSKVVVVMAVAVVVAALVWRWCNRTIPRFYQGEHPPARNRVPGEWVAS